MMRRVLLVDDNDIFLHSLAETLRHHRKDVLVETAPSAEAALLLLAVTPYDVIVTDFRLSDMDGFRFLKECTTLQPNTPIVLITGYGDVEMEKRAAECGAYAFLHKPIDVDVLISVVIRATLTSRLNRRQVSVSDADAQEVDPFIDKSREIIRRIRENTERLQKKLRHWTEE